MAEVEDGHHVADAHDQVHVMLDQADGDVQPVADGADAAAKDGGFAGIEAGGGFVEQEELGFGGQGPGQFEQTLPAVGQIAGRGVALVGQADEIEFFQGALAAFPFGPAEARGMEQAGQGTVMGQDMAAGHDVFQHGKGGEDLQVLEGADHAGGGPGGGAAAG